MIEGDKSSSRPPALIEVKDLLGLSGAAKIVAEGIIRGVGEWARPWQTGRTAKADVSAFERWSEALRSQGLPVNVAELTLGDRTALRVSAQQERSQLNRERVAISVLEEVRSNPESVNSTGKPFDPDWLDRFWTLAENVTDSDFQSIWARILVRQASSKVSYSPRTLHTLSMLTREEAETLSRLAPFSIATISSKGESTPAIWRTAADQLDPHFQNAPPRSALSAIATEIQNLIGPTRSEDFGPSGIMVEGGWAYEAYATVRDGTAKIKVAGERYELSGFPIPLPAARSSTEPAVILGSGTSFSPVGAEIVGLIAAKPSDELVELLKKAFQMFGLTLKAETRQ